TPCCHFMSTLTSCAPPRRPRLPYTTPFRSATLGRRRERLVRDAARVATLKEELERGRRAAVLAPQVPRAEAADRRVAAAHTALRSEEHTSELQSRENLVCRLLLEKKNQEEV